LQSEDFSDSSAWLSTSFGVDVTSNAAISPNGTNTADLLTGTSGSTAFRQFLAGGGITGSMTYSIYAKQSSGATEASDFILRNSTTATELNWITLDFSDGSYTEVGTSEPVVIRDNGSGWWRIELTATSGITAGDDIQLYAGFSGGSSFDESVYVWGAQLEGGDSASSYMPTTTTVETRELENATTTDMSWYSPSTPSTTYVDYRANVFDTGILSPFYLQSTSGAEQILCYAYIPTRVSTMKTVSASSTQSEIAIGPLLSDKLKIVTVGGQDTNDMVIYANNDGPTSDTSAILPGAMNILYIGGRNAGGSQLNEHVAEFRYYNVRKSNELIKQMSTGLFDDEYNTDNTVKLSVKDFSYNRTSLVEKVARNTLDPNETRTIAPHVAALSPVNFSFTTYIDPLVDTNVTSPEEYLWVSLMGDDTVTSNPTSSTINFANGNVPELHNLTLWFDQPNHTTGSYRLDNAVVDSADISFGINQIAEIVWNGRALDITEDNTPPSHTDRTGLTNCLKNKLSTIDVNMNGTGYNLALIGGGISINNNNVFYGRIKLGEIIVPTGHYTGNREIDGSLNFYLKTGTNTSLDLFDEILTNVSNTDYEDTHLANINISVGSSTSPSLKLNVPQALMNIGRQDFKEVIALNVPFIAKEETDKYFNVTYRG
jgi:hypothetical protein